MHHTITLPLVVMGLVSGDFLNRFDPQALLHLVFVFVVVLLFIFFSEQ